MNKTKNRIETGNRIMVSAETLAVMPGRRYRSAAGHCIRFQLLNDIWKV